MWRLPIVTHLQAHELNGTTFEPKRIHIDEVVVEAQGGGGAL